VSDLSKNDNLDSLSLAYKHYNQGNIKKALEIVEPLLKMDGLDAFTKIKCKILKINIYSFSTGILLGHEESLKLAEVALLECKRLDHPLLTVDAIIALSGALLDNRDHFKALPLIEEGEKILQAMEESHSARVQERLAGLLLVKGFHFVYSRRDFDSGLWHLERGLKIFKEQEHVLGMIRSYYFIGVQYMHRNMTNQATENYQRSLELARQTGNNFWFAKALNNIGIIHQEKGDLDEALNTYQQTLKLWTEQDLEGWIAHAYFRIGIVHRSKNNFDEALGHLEKSLAMRKKQGNQIAIAGVLIEIGTTYQEQFDLTRALDYYQQALAICRKKKHTGIFIYMTLFSIAHVYRFQGNYQQALEYYRECMDLGQERGIEAVVAVSLKFIGSVYREKGEFKESLEYQEQALRMVEKTGNKWQMRNLCHSLGITYHSMGNQDKARMYYQRCMVLSREMGDIIDTAEILFDTIDVSLQNDDLDTAKILLLELQELKEINKDADIIDTRYRIAKALVLKNSDRLRDKIKAQNMFQQITDEGKFSRLVITAMVNLCDLLLDELRVSGRKEIVVEVKELSNKLLGIAKNQQAYPLLIETYLLQSKLALLELNLERAQLLLTQASILADERGLVQLAEKAKNEQATLSNQLSQWEKFVEQEPPMSEIIDLTRLDELIERMVQARIYPQEDRISKYVEKAQQVVETLEKDT
jgi:tetratricopeptide (TPR) repeat protein